MLTLSPLKRSTQSELIDAEGHDAEELSHSLGQVARVDRLLGAGRALRRRLRRAGLDQGIGSVLDVGAGNGEVLSRLCAWLGANREVPPGGKTAPRGGSAPRGLALDSHPDTVVLGHSECGHLDWIRGDGRRIPLPDRSVDLVISVLTLHHLDPGDAIVLLAEMGRVARRGVVVSDLERSRLHWMGARLLASTLWRGNRLTRDDAPTSVLRAYTRDEMRGLCRGAGLPDAEVRRHAPFRLIAVVAR